MRVCAPVVGSEQITTMFQNHLHEDKSLHYGEFINDLTKYLVRHRHSNTCTAGKGYPATLSKIINERDIKQEVGSFSVKLVGFRFRFFDAI